MARFLIDEDLPRSLSDLLRHQGYECSHIIELGLRGAPDGRILQAARERRAAVVSRDLGFANVLRYPPELHYGVVVVRYPSEMRTEALVEMIGASLATIRDPEFERTIIILEPGRVRIRRSAPPRTGS